MEIQYIRISKGISRFLKEEFSEIIDLPMLQRWTGIICNNETRSRFLGEFVTKTVLRKIVKYWRRHIGERDTEEKVLCACKEVSKALNEMVLLHKFPEMKVSMVIASIEKDVLTMARVGDCACFVYRPKKGFLYHSKIDFRTWGKLPQCFSSYESSKAVPEIIQIKLEPGDIVWICSESIYERVFPAFLNVEVRPDVDQKEYDWLMDSFDIYCEHCMDFYCTMMIATLVNDGNGKRLLLTQ